MKVLHIITNLETGGAQRALYNLLSETIHDDLDSTVISLRSEDIYGSYIQELGVPVFHLDMRPGMPGPKGIIRLFRIVRRLRPGIIQGWMYHGNLAASVAGVFASGRSSLVWNVRHSLHDIKREKRATQYVVRANRYLSRSPEAIVYNSHVSRTQHEAFGFDSTRGKVIPNGFELGDPEEDFVVRASVRLELGIPKEAILFGHVARLHPMKDHAGFLRAAVSVARRVPEARFLLAGRDVRPDNPEMADVVPGDLRERFLFLGERSDVHRLMRGLDVLVSSSAWGEAFPNVLGEAMACGVPCLATDIGDSSAIVGDSGIVLPPEDTDGLSAGMLRYIDMGARQRRDLGRAGRSRIERNYGLGSVAHQYVRLYNEVNGEHNT